MINVPSYKLDNVNVFNFREYEWNEAKIVSNISEMLKAGEDYNLRVTSIVLKNKEEKDTSEIKRTRSKILEIDLAHTFEGETNNINLTYDIPWLINNHFFVSGNYKVCIYQLFDKPVIKRKNIIKIRTNIQSIMVEKKTNARKKYNYVVSLFGKKFAFAKLVICYLGVPETRLRFGLNEENEYEGEAISEDIDLLMQDVISILDNQTIDKERLLDSEFPRRMDEKIIEDIMLISKIDIFSSKYFHTDNIIEEFMYIIKEGSEDDSNYHNKRIRFVEQVIYVNMAKDFYNLINSIRKNRKNLKFSINSKSILSSVNVSNIVQFDNSLNPLSELSLLSRTSLSGPGGFEKQNVPQSLREIHSSMLYLIDPSDTADREGCGTIQYLVPNTQFNEDGTFYSPNNININSVAVSFVPFLEHDDATRLQMASSQQRHAIMLKKFDNALVQSGTEGMYSDQTSFIFKAKRDGKVIYMDDDVICVQYDNKECQAFHIGYRKLYISTVDFYKVYYNIGDRFNKDDIIAESNYMRNSRITLGRNCLVCIMPWYGYNYEDAIVISQKMVDEDKFTSVHYVDLIVEVGTNKVLLNLNDDYSDYQPLPKIGQTLRKGDVFAKVKSIDTDGFDDVLFEPLIEEVIPEDCKIADIKIYVNKWNKSFPQYVDFVQECIKKQKERKSKIVDKLCDYLTKDELDKLTDTLQINQTEKNNFKIKGDQIDGIRIEITAVYERKISVGDKIGNRHGNKGVISRIVPHDQMPTMPDGRKAEIIINPLGITSRMNVGQVFEAHLSMSVTDLKKKIREMYDGGMVAKEVYKYVLDYIKIIDKTADNNYTKQMEKIFENLPLKNFVDNLDNFFVIQPPFESIIRDEELEQAMAYTETSFEYTCLDPISGQEIQSPIAFGYMYWIKLNHIAQDKISYRGIGPYSAKTSQPLGGKSRKGGQRLGEMEIWAVIAHDAEKNLNEFISTKSDSIKLRNKYISEMMCNSDLLLDSDDDIVPQSLRLLQTNLRSLGLNYQLFEGVEIAEEIESVQEVLSTPEGEVIDIEPLGPKAAEALLGSGELDMGPSFGDKKIIYDQSIVEKKEEKKDEENGTDE